MNNLLYKDKIAKRLNAMDTAELKQAWLILKEIGGGKKLPVIADKKKLETKLAKGLKQLDNGEGTDFSSFTGSLKKKYGNR